MEDPVSSFLAKAAAWRLREVPEDASILELGLLDSVTLFALIAHLEAALAATIPPAEIVPENFGNIAAIRALARRLSGGA